MSRPIGITALLCTTFLAAAATSQNTVISPTVAATTEGNSSSGVPFATAGARRTLQLHADLGGTPKAITKISFRQNASATNFTGTRALDMELYMGDGRDPSSMSFFYDQNYVGPRALRIARKVVNFGAQGQAVTPGPNPFNGAMDLLLDTPHLHSGTAALLWDALIYSNVATGTYNSLDGDVSSQVTGTSVITGTGCIATGRTAAMTHGATIVDAGGTLALNFTVTNGPASSPAFLAVGITNPDQAIPGLCSNLQTDFAFFTLIGITSATGAITTTEAGASTLVLPNSIGGATLYSQVHCPDAGRTDPIPVTNSNGRQLPIPMPATTRVNRISRVYNNTALAMPVEGVFIAGFTVGFGVVTQFTY